MASFPSFSSFNSHHLHLHTRGLHEQRHEQIQTTHLFHVERLLFLTSRTWPKASNNPLYTLSF